MRKVLFAIALGSLLAFDASAKQKSSTKFTCTLTNTTVEKCCCIERKDGKFYCTLAKQTIAACCCKEEKAR